MSSTDQRDVIIFSNQRIFHYLSDRKWAYQSGMVLKEGGISIHGDTTFIYDQDEATTYSQPWEGEFSDEQLYYIAMVLKEYPKYQHMVHAQLSFAHHLNHLLHGDFSIGPVMKKSKGGFSNKPMREFEFTVSCEDIFFDVMFDFRGIDKQWVPRYLTFSQPDKLYQKSYCVLYALQTYFPHIYSQIFNKVRLDLVFDSN